MDESVQGMDEKFRKEIEILKEKLEMLEIKILIK
jgi:hypothetical protein